MLPGAGIGRVISAEEGFFADPEAVALLQTVQVRKCASFAPFYTKTILK
jgi:hypothetical protein